MPDYRVKTTRWYYSTVIYEVTAENENEAIDNYDLQGIQVSLSSPDWDGEETLLDIEELKHEKNIL